MIFLFFNIALGLTVIMIIFWLIVQPCYHWITWSLIIRATQWNHKAQYQHTIHSSLLMKVLCFAAIDVADKSYSRCRGTCWVGTRPNKHYILSFIFHEVKMKQTPLTYHIICPCSHSIMFLRVVQPCSKWWTHRIIRSWCHEIIELVLL